MGDIQSEHKIRNEEATSYTVIDKLTTEQPGYEEQTAIKLTMSHGNPKLPSKLYTDK